MPFTQEKRQLRQAQDRLRTTFMAGQRTTALLQQHARVIDRLLQRLWRTMSPELTLIAVGGYGRQTLFPHSDVDLLLLLPTDHHSQFDTAIEHFVGSLWDIGLHIGHSVRTPQECLTEAMADVTVQTSLLEARCLAGNATAFKALMQALDMCFDRPAFIKAKLHEQTTRHARFNDTAYNLEPNIKESPGGLRDLQNILWISRSLGLGARWTALAGNGLITPQEVRQIQRHQSLLEKMRVCLHYLAGRREDRILFDFQAELAQQLGWTEGGHRASERLMQHYYRSARFVRLMNEILLQDLQHRAEPSHAQPIVLNTHFCLRDHRLESRTSDLFSTHPETLLESFLLTQTHAPQGMSTNLVRAIWRTRTRMGSHFRHNPVHRRLFLQLLQQPTGVTSALRRMHRYGILGQYLPAFGRITGQMQHDLFHVYTVDEHILNVLRNLRRFTLTEYAHEFPLASQLIREFSEPWLLYIAALFHDIAKGRGGDHSTLGAADARKFCRQHALSAEQTALIIWLVEQHLLMSGTAQKQDLSDPAVISQFADRMGDERHLIALYLLTIADIRGTSPKIWNAWKARLLEHLFHATRHRLCSTPVSVNDTIEARQQQATIILGRYAILPPTWQPLWTHWGKGYFLRYEAADIAWHTRVLLAHAASQSPVVRARLSPGGDGIQVMTYLPDRTDIFLTICCFFESMHYSIVEARVHTTQHGYALNSFLVLDPTERQTRYRDLLSYIEYTLTEQFLTTHPPQAPIQCRVSRVLRHFPLTPSVEIKCEPDSHRHQLAIIAGDRPGLLSRIAQVFLQYQIRLHTAKINTLGERAEDTFLVSSSTDVALTKPLLTRLHNTLMHALENP